MARYDELKERALANAEALFDFWGLKYIKINDAEFDFLNPTRDDKNYGACRFNIIKGTGGDFTGSNFTNAEITSFGRNFTREDFAGIGKSERMSWGFDIIGLCQRLHSVANYTDAAKLIEKQLSEISKSKKLIKPIYGAVEKRKKELTEHQQRMLTKATKTWNLCSSFEGTLGDKYLRSRKIYIKNEPNIKYHNKIYSSEAKKFLPCLLFKVQKFPNGDLTAVHRIYLSKEGNKADLVSPKMALGSIQGAAIWFGGYNKKYITKLCIAEGPENALSIRCLGYDNVVSTINATNYGNLIIPHNVKEILLFPDPDEAGQTNAKKAISNYQKQKKQVKIVWLPKQIMPNGKQADWNDIIMS